MMHKEVVEKKKWMGEEHPPDAQLLHAPSRPGSATARHVYWMADASRTMGALKAADNPYFKTKYADLASIMETIQKPLAENGLAIISTMDYEPAFPDSTIICTTLIHESGQWIRGKTKMQVALPANRQTPNPQEIGSMITYGRRYGITAMLSLATEDDDGAAASGTVIGMAKEVFPGSEEVNYETLRSALEAAGVGVIKVLQRYKVENLEDLTQDQMIETYTKLKQRKGAK